MGSHSGLRSAIRQEEGSCSRLTNMHWQMSLVLAGGKEGAVFNYTFASGALSSEITVHTHCRLTVGYLPQFPVAILVTEWGDLNPYAFTKQYNPLLCPRVSRPYNGVYIEAIRHTLVGGYN